jgi:hypothetical protein
MALQDDINSLQTQITTITSSSDYSICQSTGSTLASSLSTCNQLFGANSSACKSASDQVTKCTGITTNLASLNSQLATKKSQLAAVPVPANGGTPYNTSQVRCSCDNSSYYIIIGILIVAILLILMYKKVLPMPTITS